MTLRTLIRTNAHREDWHDYAPRFTGTCADCGRAVYAVSTRCKPCSMREVWRKRREAREVLCTQRLTKKSSGR